MNPLIKAKIENPLTLSQRIDGLEGKIRRLSNVDQDDRIWDLKRTILKEREPILKPLKEELAKLVAERAAKRRPPTPRWPENCPEKVVKACEKYWSGTTNCGNFRIHAWNDKHILTSYPGGSAYNRFNGAEYYSAGYSLIPVNCTGTLDGKRITLPGRACKKTFEEVLAKA